MEHGPGTWAPTWRATGAGRRVHFPFAGNRGAAPGKRAPSSRWAQRRNAPGACSTEPFSHPADEAHEVFDSPEVRAMLEIGNSCGAAPSPADRRKRADAARSLPQAPTAAAPSDRRRRPQRLGGRALCSNARRIATTGSRATTGRIGRPLARLDGGPVRRTSPAPGRCTSSSTCRCADAGLGYFEPRFTRDPGEWRAGVEGGKHHLGTTRMHADPRQGVVDADARVHGLPTCTSRGARFSRPGAREPDVDAGGVGRAPARHLETSHKKSVRVSVYLVNGENRYPRRPFRVPRSAHPGHERPALHFDLRLPDERIRLGAHGGRAARVRGPRAHQPTGTGGRRPPEHLLGAREGAGEGVLPPRPVAAAEARQARPRHRRRRLRREPGGRGHPRARAVRGPRVRAADHPSPAGDDRGAARDARAAGGRLLPGDREVRPPAGAACRRRDGVRLDHGRLQPLLQLLRRALHARRGDEPPVRAGRRRSRLARRPGRARSDAARART